MGAWSVSLESRKPKNQVLLGRRSYFRFCTFNLEPDVNWQVCPVPSFDTEAEENIKSHGTASNVPLISWDEELPVKSTVT